jgi:hypothetical protein
MKKEIIIYFIILLILAFIQHTDLLTAPIERFQELPESGAYGLGAAHPLIFALIGYFALGILRLLYKGIKKAFFKEEK